MRSLLFVPGNSEKMIAKASAGPADVIILDLEDAVRADAKPEARKVVVATCERAALMRRKPKAA